MAENEDSVRVTRLHVRHVRAQPEIDRPGILLVGLPSKDGMPALVLIWDEGAANHGTSATNCMPHLLSWIAENWSDFGVQSAIVVERDSMEAFNHVYVNWIVEPPGNPKHHPLVTFTPMRWPGTEPCSSAAMFSVLGVRGQVAFGRAASFLEIRSS